MRQTGKEDTLEVVTAVARQRIVREYEQVLEPLDAKPKVVLSSTLAVLPLLSDAGSTLLVRMCGKTMTTVITRDGNLSIYRSTEMSNDAATLDVQAMLDEIFPAVAFYQDSWGSSPDRARITGFGAREELFRRSLGNELKNPVGSLSDSESAVPLNSSAKDLMQHDLDALVGWMLNER